MVAFDALGLPAVSDVLRQMLLWMPNLAVGLIVLVIVGGKRLPQLGRQIGGGVKEFKDSVTTRADKQWDDDGDDQRVQVQSALGRPESETEPLDGEVVRERET